MRDKTHLEQVERWADYVKRNPDKWKKEHTGFIDSQIKIAERFYNNLAKTEKGKTIFFNLRKEKLLQN